MLQAMTAKTVKQKYTPNLPPLPEDRFYAGVKKGMAQSENSFLKVFKATQPLLPLATNVDLIQRTTSFRLYLTESFAMSGRRLL
jgi:hypothetical protein